MFTTVAIHACAPAPMSTRSARPLSRSGSNTMIDSPPTQRKSMVGDRMDAVRGGVAEVLVMRPESTERTIARGAVELSPDGPSAPYAAIATTLGNDRALAERAAAGTGRSAVPHERQLRVRKNAALRSFRSGHGRREYDRRDRRSRDGGSRGAFAVHADGTSADVRSVRIPDQGEPVRE